MTMPGRSYEAETPYRYGFNGKKNDNSTAEGSYDFGARIYDGRIGRWLSCDLKEKKYPNFTPYNFGLCSPIYFIDPDGNDIIGVGTIDYLNSSKGAFNYINILTSSDVWKELVKSFEIGGMYDKNKIDLKFGNFPKGKNDKIPRSAPGTYPTAIEGETTVPTLAATSIIVKIKGGGYKDITTITEAEFKKVERYQIQILSNKNPEGDLSASTLSHELSTHALSLGNLLNEFIDKKGDLTEFKNKIKDLAKADEKDVFASADHQTIGGNTGNFRKLNLSFFSKLSKTLGALTKISDKGMVQVSGSSRTYYPDNLLNRAVGVTNLQVMAYNKDYKCPGQYPKASYTIDGSTHKDDGIKKPVAPNYSQ